MFYGNAEDFQNYLLDRGFDIPVTWDDDKINSALLVSSEWLDNHYENFWIGYKVDFHQERSWPRQSAVVATYPSYTYGTDEIPLQVIQATYELARRELAEQGSLSVDYRPSAYSNVSVYNAVTVGYNPSVASAGDLQLQIPIVQDLMTLLIDPEKGSGSGGMSGKAVRV